MNGHHANGVLNVEILEIVNIEKNIVIRLLIKTKMYDQRLVIVNIHVNMVRNVTITIVIIEQNTHILQTKEKASTQRINASHANMAHNVV
jgi:hypothetical protein